MNKILRYVTTISVNHRKELVQMTLQTV